jgi:hypothetical protein
MDLFTDSTNRGIIMASSYFRLLCFGGLLFSVHVAVAYAADVEPPSGDFRSQFEVRYNAWRKWINEHPTAGSHEIGRASCRERV